MKMNFISGHFFVNFGVRTLIWELLQSGNCNL